MKALMVLVGLLCCGSSVCYAQVTPKQGVASLSIGKIVAVMDTNSGRFGATTTDGTMLLFARGAYMTSHISVKVNDVVFTNHIPSQMRTPDPLRNLGKGKPTILSDRLRYEWEKEVRGFSVRIRLELEPVIGNEFNELRIHVTVENAGTQPIEAGFTVMEDVSAGSDDAVVLVSGKKEFLTEVKLGSGQMPTSLAMKTAAFLPDSAICRLIGAGVLAPDELVVGSWTYHGYLGTAVYGYTASGRKIQDTGMLLQWNTERIEPTQQRQVSTAISLKKQETQILSRPTTFAKRFFLLHGDFNEYAFYIVSDTVSTVHIAVPGQDMRWEAAASRDRKWDTTVVVRPGQPAMILVDHTDSTKIDSIQYYQALWCELTATADIAVGVQADYGTYDFNTLYPRETHDTMYLFPGAMGLSELAMNLGDSPVRLYMGHIYPYKFRHYAAVQNPRTTPLSIALPGKTIFRSTYRGDLLFDPWKPEYYFQNVTYSPGAGDTLQSAAPFECVMDYTSPVIPGAYRSVPPMLWQHRTLRVPSRSQLGREYLFVPFRKPRLNHTEDLLRIVSYEDDTRIGLGEGSAAITLDGGSFVDTLLSSPAVIRSNNPVAVYQHHLDWSWIGSDTMYFGGAYALLPEQQWGNRYFVCPALGLKPSISEYLANRWPRSYDFRFNNLYLIIIKKHASHAPILLDSVIVDESAFQKVGDYSFRYLGISAEYHDLESVDPFLVVVCGGGDFNSDIASPFGMSHIPPYKTVYHSKVVGSGNRNSQATTREAIITK